MHFLEISVTKLQGGNFFMYNNDEKTPLVLLDLRFLEIWITNFSRIAFGYECL